MRAARAHRSDVELSGIRLMQEGTHAYRLAEIVQRFGGELLGDPDVVITQVATLETAGPGQISFFSNSRYRRQLEHTRAEAVILTQDAADATQRSRIVCKDPYAYFARLSALLNPPATVVPAIHLLQQVSLLPFVVRENGFQQSSHILGINVVQSESVIPRTGRR